MVFNRKILGHKQYVLSSLHVFKLRLETDETYMNRFMSSNHEQKLIEWCCKMYDSRLMT